LTVDGSACEAVEMARRVFDDDQMMTMTVL
jgi:hypothetical protein